jgi:hypothetical protein
MAQHGAQPTPAANEAGSSVVITPEITLERRLALFHNGYQDLLPLTPPFQAVAEGGRLGSKACVMRGWQSLKVKEESLRRWRHYTVDLGWVRVPSLTTGLRTSTRVGGIDLDIDDEAVVWDVVEALRDAFGRAWYDDTMVRLGSGEKLCLVTGLSGDVLKGKVIGKKWGPRNGDTSGHIEVFHAASHQIGIDGVHSYQVIEQPRRGIFTVDPVLEPAILYRFTEGPTPFDTPRKRLGKLTYGQLQQIEGIVEGVFRDHGWMCLQPDQGSGGPWRFDLDTEVMFDVMGLGQLSYDQLTPGMRLNMSSITGEDSSSQDRGKVIETETDGEFWCGVMDFKTDERRFPARAKRLERSERMGAMMRGLLAQRPTTKKARGMA